MRFGLDVATAGAWADPRILTELAREAETAGWDGFFLWDLLTAEVDTEPVVDSWITLASIAAATSRIRIGTMVTPLPRRLPWELARAAVTLDRLSNGRVVFGAGLGWRTVEFERLGLAADLRTRADRLDEGLELIDRLWTGEPVTFEGEHYRIRDVRLRPVPVQRPRIPIWVAAGWPRPRPLARASRWDGVYLMTDNQATHQRLTPEDARAAIAAVALQRSEMSGFEVAVNVDTLEALDDGTAITREFAEAGVTWTIELTPDSLEAHRELIRRGPPRPS
jgi:alkanesulfonate monooxygenase SsuD/methylene tetrahydromethanopterin reductase-like flavin-dependent oxidoreductase (luciferase family)